MDTTTTTAPEQLISQDLVLPWELLDIILMTRRNAAIARLTCKRYSTCRPDWDAFIDIFRSVCDFAPIKSALKWPDEPNNFIAYYLFVACRVPWRFAKIFIGPIETTLDAFYVNCICNESSTWRGGLTRGEESAMCERVTADCRSNAMPRSNRKLCQEFEKYSFRSALSRCAAGPTTAILSYGGSRLWNWNQVCNYCPSRKFKRGELVIFLQCCANLRLVFGTGGPTNWVTKLRMIFASHIARRQTVKFQNMCMIACVLDLPEVLLVFLDQPTIQRMKPALRQICANADSLSCAAILVK